MIITDKFIFVHVPKTGGASMLQALNGPRKRGHAVDHYQGLPAKRSL